MYLCFWLVPSHLTCPQNSCVSTCASQAICHFHWQKVQTEGYVPDYLNQDRIEGRFQQRYELMLKRREMAGVYHTSHRHCNNCQTVSNLQAKGIECNHLKRYILAHKCDACDAAPGRRHHKVRTTTKAKRKAKSASNIIAPLPATVAACDLRNRSGL